MAVKLVSGSLLLECVIGWNMIISGFSVLISFLFSIITGILFGVYPGHRVSLIKGLSSE